MAQREPLGDRGKYLRGPVKLIKHLGSTEFEKLRSSSTHRRKRRGDGNREGRSLAV